MPSTSAASSVELPPTKLLISGTGPQTIIYVSKSTGEGGSGSISSWEIYRPKKLTKLSSHIIRKTDTLRFTLPLINAVSACRKIYKKFFSKTKSIYLHLIISFGKKWLRCITQKCHGYCWCRRYISGWNRSRSCQSSGSWGGGGRESSKKICLFEPGSVIIAFVKKFQVITNEESCINFSKFCVSMGNILK